MRGAAKEIPSTASASTPAARAGDGAEEADGVGDGSGAADTGAERMRRSYRATPIGDTGARLLAIAWPA
jgi:hypothetical protein